MGNWDFVNQVEIRKEPAVNVSIKVE